LQFTGDHFGCNVRHIDAHLNVDVDGATAGNGRASLVGGNRLAVVSATHGLEHQVTYLR